MARYTCRVCSVEHRYCRGHFKSRPKRCARCCRLAREA